MQDGALNDALKSQGWLRVDIALAFEGRYMFVNETGDVPTQLLDVAPTGAQRVGC